MKFKFFLFTLLLGLVFISCGSDDNAPVNPTDSVVGTWKLTSADGSQLRDLNMDGVGSTDIIEELPCFEDTIIIKDDNTYVRKITDIIVNVDSVGVLLIVTADCTDVILTETGVWSLEGDQLMFVPIGMDTSTVTVELTETTLSFMGRIDGLEVITPETLVFTRQQ